MFETLRGFSESLDREAVRVYRPHHSVFLCGGLISKVDDERSVLSVRDYLVRIRPIAKKLDGRIVLAETAQQLYRDTGYPDLISFEEDVARISSIVLVISESAGSLAELGAFASEPVIRPALRILISEEHAADESFVRFGPVKRIETANRNYVGVFPWRSHKRKSAIVKQSISPHYSEIIKFINDRLDEVPKSYRYHLLDDKAIFYDIIWLLSILEVASPAHLYDAVRIVHPNALDGELRDKLYVLRSLGWIASFPYSAQDYYYLPNNEDPFKYAFLAGKRVRDIPAKKLEISTEFRNSTNIARAVVKRLQQKRGEA